MAVKGAAGVVVRGWAPAHPATVCLVFAVACGLWFVGAEVSPEPPSPNSYCCLEDTVWVAIAVLVATGLALAL